MHYLIHISFSLFLESTLDNEIQTPIDETVEATCNEEEVGQATAQPMICQGKKRKRQKLGSFQNEIIALQREQLAAQAQQVQHNREFFQMLDAQNRMEEREKEKDLTFLLELGKLFANQK